MKDVNTMSIYGLIFNCKAKKKTKGSIGLLTGKAVEPASLSPRMTFSFSCIADTWALVSLFPTLHIEVRHRASPRYTPSVFGSSLKQHFSSSSTLCQKQTRPWNSQFQFDKGAKGKRYSVYSLVSTEVLTRPSSPSRHCTYRNHFNPPGDIPEQLAAYSAHTLSTALFMLGTHFAAG